MQKTLESNILDALPALYDSYTRGLTATEIAQKVRPGASNSKWASPEARGDMRLVRTTLARLVRNGNALRNVSGRYFCAEPSRVAAARAARAKREQKRAQVRQALEAAGFLRGPEAVARWTADNMASAVADFGPERGPLVAAEWAQEEADRLNLDKLGFNEVTLSYDQFLELARRAGIVD